MTNIDDFSLILYRLAEAYGYKLTVAQVKNYHTALWIYPRLVLVQAVDQLMRTVKFFPRIAEIAREAQTVLKTFALDPTSEQMYWMLYRRNYASTDEITEAEVISIYQAANVKMVRPIEAMAA